MFKDTEGLTRSHISKHIQYNGQTKKGQKGKQRSTNITQKTKDQATRMPLKTGVNSCALEG